MLSTKRNLLRLLSLTYSVVLALVAACSDDTESAGPGAGDGGTLDATANDGARADATSGDSGAIDSATTDSANADSATDAAKDAGADADAATCPALHFAESTTVTASSDGGLDWGAATTIELWLHGDVQPDSGAPSNGVITNKWASAQEDKYLGIESGHVYVYLHTNGAPVSAGNSTSVPSGRWTHIALVRDATSVRIYVDGQKQEEIAGAVTVQNSGGTVQIGHVSRDYQRAAVVGLYSELRFSKVARYTANFTPPAHLTVDSDTQALWKFDEGGGTIANDTAGGHHGTITGATWALGPCR